jgi:hypothetical protein
MLSQNSFQTIHHAFWMALIRRGLEESGFSRVAIETKAEQSRASSLRIPAVAYCQETPLRNEIETRDAGKLEPATDYVAFAIADRHGLGEVAAKIQAHVIALQLVARRLRFTDGPTSDRGPEAVEALRSSAYRF